MRIVEIENTSYAERELQNIGSDPAGVRIMAPKSVFRVLKLNKIPSVAANVLKQEMLSLGGEAATSYHSVDLSSRTTDLLIMGSQRQLRQLVKKLKLHAFGLPRTAVKIETALQNYDHPPAPLRIGGKTFHWGRRTYLMGILNLTPDSFYDGGKYFNPVAALKQAQELIAAGADIIDVGGESTRPGARPVPVKEELRRVLPVIAALKKYSVVISIDTRKAAVAEAALKAGAHIINDISALRHDKSMAKVAALYSAPVILMHMQGDPQTMQRKPAYRELISEIMDHLEGSIAIARKAGIPQDHIIVDPGFGFGKLPEHNLEILKRLREFRILGCPLLIGTSRKSTIGAVLNAPAEERLWGTAATVAIAISKGADIIRIHDVDKLRQVAKMSDAIVRRK